MTTLGQRRALRELEAVAHADSSALAILESPDDIETGPSECLIVPVRISTAGLRHFPGGLPLSDTEDLEIRIPPNFPIEPPLLFATDFRLAGYPHVTGRVLCLYIDPDRQWSPADGMFGFVQRMSEWFAAAAAGVLDPDGGPIHPPVALGIGYSDTQLVIRSEIPEGQNKRLLWAELDFPGGRRVELVSFHGSKSQASKPAAVAVIADTPITEDYAWTFGRLLAQLGALGFEGSMVVRHILAACFYNLSGTPLVVVVGTLNRGTRRARRYHLVAWELPAGLADKIRSLEGPIASPEQAESARRDFFCEELRWVTVHEARPSVTVRRDRESPMSAFAGRRIEIWGCGALGGWIAEMITRAGPAQLVLRDRGRVGPGLLARQPYDESHIAELKAEALAERLRRIASQGLVVEPHLGDVLNSDGTVVDFGEADLLIDATASRPVAAALERHITGMTRAPPVVSVLIDARCSMTAMFAAPAEGNAGPSYAARRAREDLARTPCTAHFVEAFWDSDGAEDLVQPEPGCSAPTFHGSAADAATAAGALANQVARFLADPTAFAAEFCVLPHAESHAEPPVGLRHFRSEAPIPLAITANDGYTVLVSETARQAILEFASNGFETVPAVETGGTLYGECDDATMSIAVDIALGPTTDSVQKPTRFVRGVDGTAEQSRAVEQGSPHRRTAYLGDWHTHPNAAPRLSAVDKDTAKTQARDGASLVVVCGGTPDAPQWGAQVTQPDLGQDATSPADPVQTAAPAVKPSQSHPIQPPAARTECKSPTPPRRPLAANPAVRSPIMVALSGGGLRATLAALGVLRFLTDAHLLPDVRIISSVSGGSIANAVLASHWDQAQHQPAFDDLVLRPAFEGVTKSSLSAGLLMSAWKALLPRTNLTKLLADRLDRHFLHGQELEDLPPGCWFMINAANVTEGVRFRFDADVVGDYVNGSIPTAGTGLRLATAVAASGAVPGYFPPLDVRHLGFPCNAGHPVELIDGGAYDNLALEPLMRREREHDGLGSALIISLDAGAILDRGPRRGMGRLPMAGSLWRAMAMMHRQASSVRIRSLFEQQNTPGGRQCASFNLNSAFSENELDADQKQRLTSWRDLNQEHTERERAYLASIPTTFSKLGKNTALALVQRGWWLCGATLSVHHPHILTHPPKWVDPTGSGTSSHAWSVLSSTNSVTPPPPKERQADRAKPRSHY